MTSRSVRWVASPWLLLMAIAASAQYTPPTTEDRLELGLGVGALLTPDYRGSRTYRHLVAPFPYFVYRGEIIRSDREGVRGDLFRSDQLEFTLSLAASLRPDSDENERREGMPELSSTLEMGPAVNINVTGDTLREGWMLTLPVRAVVTFGRGSPDFIGWLTEPQLSYRFRRESWNWTFRTGPAFASEAYHDYYYEVGQEQVRPDRELYNARGGYSGYNNQLTVSRRSGQLWYAFFVRHYHLRGAGFLESPLVETDSGSTGGIAISWILY